jgi:histidyl-tRNA synthetase
METIKGFKDYVGKEAEKKVLIREIIRNVFERYGFNPVETPIIESEKFVKGDNSNDEAVSDIFRLKDKGKRELALRYEFTFQLKRLMRNQKMPFKRYQIGSVFRDEPVKGNRLRQFTQCDADIVGSTIKDEAENFAMAQDILKALKIESVVYFNNRKLLNEILESMKIKKKEEVIRELDKWDKLPAKTIKENLARFGAEDLLSVVKKGREFFEQFESYNEVKELESYCRAFGVQIVFAPFLARGLSYYNGTIFEVKSKKMKETIIAGGSFMFNGVQATGISFGLERLCAVTNMVVDLEKYLIVSLNEDRKAIQLAQKLRKQSKIVSIFYGKPSKALEFANSYGIKKVIFVGSKEVKVKRFRIKNLDTGRESLLKI